MLHNLIYSPFCTGRNIRVKRETIVFVGIFTCDERVEMLTRGVDIAVVLVSSSVSHGGNCSTSRLEVIFELRGHRFRTGISCNDRQRNREHLCDIVIIIIRDGITRECAQLRNRSWIARHGAPRGERSPHLDIHKKLIVCMSRI